MLRLLASAALLIPAAASAQVDPVTPAPLPNTPSQPVAQPTIDVDRIVVAGFPTYDTDGVAGLSPTEFAGWIAQLFANARLSVPDGAYMTQAFIQTDQTKDGQVQPGELVAFLRS